MVIMVTVEFVITKLGGLQIPTDTREELLTHLRKEKLKETGGCSALSLPASVWPGGWDPSHSSEH